MLSEAKYSETHKKYIYIYIYTYTDRQTKLWIICSHGVICAHNSSYTSLRLQSVGPADNSETYFTAGRVCFFSPSGLIWLTVQWTTVIHVKYKKLNRPLYWDIVWFYLEHGSPNRDPPSCITHPTATFVNYAYNTKIAQKLRRIVIPLIFARVTRKPARNKRCGPLP